MEVVSELVDLFASSNDTFLRVFGGQKSPHLLSRYAIDKLVMQEVAYHLSAGLLGVLHRKKKAHWPVLPLQIGLCEIKNLKVADIEGKDIEKFAFGCLDFNPYDPRNVCKEQCARIYFQWPSEAFYRPKEGKMKNCYNTSKSRKPISSAGTSQVIVGLSESSRKRPRVQGRKANNGPL